VTEFKFDSPLHAHDTGAALEGSVMLGFQNVGEAVFERWPARG
jgi:hypothetical protein